MICKSRGMLKGLLKTRRLLLLLVFAVEGGFADMPMLNWMGREKAARATKDVVMKILREDKELSYGVFSAQSHIVAERMKNCFRCWEFRSLGEKILKTLSNSKTPRLPVAKATRTLRLCDSALKIKNLPTTW